MKYSIVLPVYNEEIMIPVTMSKIAQVFNDLDENWEVIAVDDGSTDRSSGILDEMADRINYPLHVVHHPYNKGMGASLKSGIKAANGEFIIWIDADGQHDPKDLLTMMPYMASYDLVIGARPFQQDGKWHRNIANKFYNGLSSYLTNFDIQDLTSGYRVFRAEVLKKFYHLFPQRFSSATTSTLALLKAGYNIKFVPINIKPRQAGTSKIKLFKDGIKFTTIIFKIILLFEPMKVFLPVTAISFILGLFGMIISIIREGRFLIPNSSVLLFVLGVFAFLMGLLAEHLTAIQMAIIEES